MWKRWFVLIVLACVAGWFTWQLFVMADPADVGLFGFIAGPALLLFVLGAAFGAVWLRPAGVDRKAIRAKRRESANERDSARRSGNVNW